MTLAEILPDDVTEVVMPDESSWYRDRVQHCEGDDRLRPYSPWRDVFVTCNGCGQDRFNVTP